MASYEEMISGVRASIHSGQYDVALTQIASIPGQDDPFTWVDLDIEKLRCYVMLRSTDLAKSVADDFISTDQTRLAYMASKGALAPFVDVLLNFIYLISPNTPLGDPVTFPYRKFIADCGQYDVASGNSIYQIYMLYWNCENDYLSRNPTGEYFTTLLSALTPETISSLVEGHRNLLRSISKLLQSMATNKDAATKATVQIYVNQVESL